MIKWHVLIFLSGIIMARRYYKYYKLSLLRNFPFYKTNRNFLCYKTNRPFYKTNRNFLCYKTNRPFYKTKLRITILTFHILKLSSYQNINIYILILIFYNIKLNCYYKTKLLITILTSALYDFGLLS